MTAPTPEDLEIARADALLQLRIGRSAHYYAILVSAALILDAVLVLAFPPPLAANDWSASNLFFLFPPVAAAVFVAFLGLFLKWDEYQLWPWERHFWATVLAVVAAGVAAYLLVAGLFAFGPTANWSLVPGLFPLAVGAVCLAMAGLALTWPSRSSRQMTSLVAAVLPFPLAFVVFVNTGSASGHVEALALVLFGAAWLFQTSGSFLHLISSGTRAHEREMIQSGQTRMFTVADELAKRERSVQLREATALQKETDLDDLELSLKRRGQAADEQRAHLDSMEADLRTRSDALAGEQKKWAAQAADAARGRREVDDQQADLRLREQQLADRASAVGEREARVAVKEGEFAGREADLGRRRGDGDRRETALKEGETRLDAQRADLERRSAELAQQEAKLRSREMMATATDQDRATLAQRISDLETREARLQQLDLTLKELQASIQRQTASNSTAATGLAEREEQQGRAAAALATREAELSRREEAAQAAVRTSASSRAQYEQALKDHTTRSDEMDARAADLDRRLDQIQTRERAATDAERTREREAKLLDERQRALDRREAELRERVRALGGMTPLPVPGSSGPPALEPAGPLAPDRRRLPDRESTGSPRMDDLLLGGLPPKAHVLLLGPPFLGKELLLYQYVGEGLRRGESVVLLSAGRPSSESADALRAVLPELDDRQRKGQVVWLDAQAPAGPGGREAGAHAGNPKSPAELLAAVVQAARTAEASGQRIRVGVLGLGHLLRGLPAADAPAFFQNLVGILKTRDALALYTLDSGVLDDALLNVVQSRTDGVVEFREERGRTFFAVRGLGDVESREWIEYRTNPAGLVIGSFRLERIR